MIPLTCDHCDKNLRLRDELAGRNIKCPGCGNTLTVPLLDDEDDDMPPPKSKAATFTPTKSTRARDDEDEDDEDDRASRTKKVAGSARKPSPVFLILGLILGLGGLVAMSACIVVAKQANDKVNEALGEKDHIIKQYQKDLDQPVNEFQKQTAIAGIEKLEREKQNIPRDDVTRYTIFAVACGIVFLVGFGLRGYYHVAMKKWHADAHGTAKKRKRRDPEDDDDEVD